MDDIDNGENDWKVSYSSISWFENALNNHGNVICCSRSRDIFFRVDRKRPSDSLCLLLVNTYTFGVADYYRAKAEFPDLTCIALAGDWDGYTPEAKELTDSMGVGLCVPRDLFAALWKENPNKYVRKNREHTPRDRFRGA